MLDNDFPMLETLSLSNDHGPCVLPTNFAAPHLRILHLRNIAIDRISLVLANATNLLSLRLERIPSPGDFPPEYLVEHIASMPHLENISIKYAAPQHGDGTTEYPDSSRRVPEALKAHIHR